MSMMVRCDICVQSKHVDSFLGKKLTDEDVEKFNAMTDEEKQKSKLKVNREKRIEQMKADIEDEVLRNKFKIAVEENQEGFFIYEKYIFFLVFKFFVLCFFSMRVHRGLGESAKKAKASKDHSLGAVE